MAAMLQGLAGGSVTPKGRTELKRLLDLDDDLSRMHEA
jgi:hypothetical protein